MYQQLGEYEAVGTGPGEFNILNITRLTQTLVQETRAAPTKCCLIGRSVQAPLRTSFTVAMSGSDVKTSQFSSCSSRAQTGWDYYISDSQRQTLNVAFLALILFSLQMTLEAVGSYR